jgi:pimeloyl-ACP methyl ester carboxylesterase
VQSPDPPRTPATAQRWWRRLVLAVGAVIAVLLARTPDLPKDYLEKKYAPSPSAFLDLPGGARVHYRDQGSPVAPALVLLHGSNSSLHTWEPWVRVLSTTFRVVTLDLPGHGLTGPVPGDDYSPGGMAAFLDEFRKKLGLRRFSLAGNSMGGNVSVRYTLAHPDVVEKLVLVDAGGVNHLLPPESQPEVPIGFRMIRTPGINRIASFTTPRRFVEKTTRALFVDQSLVTKEMVDRYYELLLYPGNRRATRLRAATSMNLPDADRLGEIRAPTLILWGSADRLVPPPAAEIFHTRIRGSRIIEYPDVGHLPMEEVADRSAADTLVFLRSSPAAQGADFR